MGYLEAMTLGDSASAVLDCLEGGIWMHGKASNMIFGDSMSGVALLSNPDGLGGQDSGFTRRPGIFTT